MEAHFYHVAHSAIDCLIAALEARDPYTRGHSSRVAKLTELLLLELGVGGREAELIHLAAHLHDIGKIGIPDEILHKPGKLTPAEWAKIQEHPVIGYRILSHAPSLKEIAVLVLHHHERWDGKGYPEGLRGEAIPFGSRVIAVADAIDAMLSARPYRPPLTPLDCLAEIERGGGKQFDPLLVGPARRILLRLERLRSRRRREKRYLGHAGI
ncbi:metal dependent phosphohydrolase [Ammonifex degensii KC4]|uniref:Metal dependent phosphohydrolase n=1 Tax=Ammonifex degensii (strain DSM 10501 / KC4) TaxID=429009 RepID=C9RC09_AMMDK|nr:HD-GYP domain-containing protein [Ammonifex degensii]ACX51786.1 metal dependent phosphohydrolase [Ammonifex degensii KC4]